MEPWRIDSPDGVWHEALVALPGAPSDQVALILPAMGVPARYYGPLAEALAVRGTAAVVLDLRGTGSSSQIPSRHVDFGYDEVVRLDLPAAVAAVRQRFARAQVHGVGHSLGGQLASLALARDPRLLDTLALVASGSVHWRAFPGLQAPSALVRSQLAGVIARGLGYFPGHRLGFGGLQPRQLILDWTAQIRTGRYEPRGPAFDYELKLREVRLPLLALSLEGDLLTAPFGVDALCAKMPAARLDRRHVRLAGLAATGKDVHFRWARAPDGIADLLAQWWAQS